MGIRGALTAYVDDRRKLVSMASWVSDEPLDVVQEAAIEAWRRDEDARATNWALLLRLHARALASSRREPNIGLALDLRDAADLAATAEAREALRRIQRRLSARELGDLLDEYSASPARIRIARRKARRAAA